MLRLLLLLLPAARAALQWAAGLPSRAQRGAAVRACCVAEDEVARLCALLPDVHALDACTLERLRYGNTNVLYRLRRARDEVGAESFLVRVFGRADALEFDRRKENEVFARLAAEGLAPPLIATFPGGRIEGWLEGGPCTPEQCRTPEVYSRVARALAALHAFRAPGTEAAGSAARDGCWGWDAAERWLRGARSNVAALAPGSAAEAALVRRARSIDVDRVALRLLELRRLLSGRRLPLCFCHNDLSHTNVHRDAATGALSLIDFEFSGTNLRGFDLATHLSHWAGGASDGLYNDDAYPTEFERAAFFEQYALAAVERRGGARVAADADGVADGDVRRMCAELEAETAAAAPLAHACWGLWALCALPPNGGVGAGAAGFSHIEYAERRLAAFERSLDDLGRSSADRGSRD